MEAHLLLLLVSIDASIFLDKPFHIKLDVHFFILWYIVFLNKFFDYKYYLNINI